MNSVSTGEAIRELDLDWTLAIRRFSMDIRDDFFPDPYEYSDLTSQPKRTQEAILGRLSTFYPKTASRFDVPKKGLTLRESFYIDPLDRIIYQALIDRIIHIYDSQFESSSYSHRLRHGKNRRYIFKHGVNQWKLFKQSVLSKCKDTGNGCIVVETDVAAFYENLNISELKKSLDNLASGDPSLLRVNNILATLLKAWSPYTQYGLPQNTDPSSFLGNAYLHEVDQRLLRDGFSSFRYMDDIRIVVKDEATARL